MDRYEHSSAPSLARRCILSMMLSANTDPELSQWLRWATESGDTPMFVRKVADASLIACSPDYVLLRPVLVELKRRYPEWRGQGKGLPAHWG